MIEIRTDRLLLRSLDNRDATALAHAANDPELSRWIPHIPYPYTLDDAQSFIRNSHHASGPVLGIFLQNTMIGVLSLDGHFGIWLIESHRKQGFASEAAHAFIAAHFARRGDASVHSGYLDGNQPSQAMLENLGFQPCGSHDVTRPNGQIALQRDMILTPEHWRAGYGFPIYTQNLFLRPLAEDDIAELQFIAANAQVAPYLMSVSIPWPKSAVRTWIKQGQPTGKPGFRLGVCLQGGRLIGAIGLGPGAYPSLFYFISEQFWGRGFATESARALLGFAFARYGLDAVQADSFTDNPASMRVLGNLGFEKTGQGTGTSLARLEPAPVNLYRLTRTKFESAS